MKHISSILIAASCFLLGMSRAEAQTTFAADGLRYTVLQGQTVSVCYNDEDSLFLSGRVVIPAEVTNPATQSSYQVVAIADSAFKGCDLIETLVLPASITKVGLRIIDNCFNLRAYEVASGNGAFKAVDGVLFTADGTQLVSCPTAQRGEYVFPKGVTSLAPAAFSTCKNLTHVTLPEGLKEVPDYAFYECWGIANVDFPKSLEKIGDYAFDGTILQFLKFYGKLKSVGRHAFYRSSMVECMCLGSQPAELGEDAFGNDMNYTRLYVPSGTSRRYERTAWKVFPTIYEGNRSRRWKSNQR